MKRHIKFIISMVLSCILTIPTAYISFAETVTYTLKYIGSNTVQVTLKGANPGEYIQLRSVTASKGKNLYVHYGIVKNKSEEVTTASVDCRVFGLVPPIRVLLKREGSEEPVFHDIQGHEAELYIQHLHDAGIVKGYEGGIFKPEGSITRAEFFTMMVKAKGYPITNAQTNEFTDLNNHWGKDLIMTAVNNNLVKGNGDGTIRPDDPVTIGQVAVVIDRAYPLRALKDGVYSKLANSNHYAARSMKKMLDAGIVNIEDSMYRNFNLDRPATRAECAMMISRAMVN
ncbi:MAG: S-layer homology domain-containing protein [Clostridiaceae bacterium]|nr:S-layer homology domain-containing protein [Clostridiaceae bacterium]